MDDLQFIPATFIDRYHNYTELIEHLRQAFAEDRLNIPNRLHYDFGVTERTANSTLLIMPAWQNGQDMGIKLVTINPENAGLQLPAIQGVYILMDTRTGRPRKIIDAKALTRKRTAATSALAASYLATPQATTLLMVGTGALAPELIAAHASVRPIKEVLIWGRNPEKARQLSGSLVNENYSVTAVQDIRDAVPRADIISTATLSTEPLIFGADLRPGQHLDLVGAYKPTMRESDDEAVQRAEIFVDTYEGAIREGGDLAIPLAEGTIQRGNIRADLRELCGGQTAGRSDADRITLFKSVGYALEDLVAARYYADLFAAKNTG